MFSKFNIQYLLSYLGLLPFFFISFNKYFFFIINHSISKQFIIFYCLIISVFIGAINWNFEKNIKIFLAIYSIIPSLFALLIIILSLYNVNIYYLIFFIISFLLAQLFFDYILIYFKAENANTFFYLRLPLTTIIIINILIIIF